MFQVLDGRRGGDCRLEGYAGSRIGNEKPVLRWPFDGSLNDLLKPGSTVIVETYPAECYGWFFQGAPLLGKGSWTLGERLPLHC